MGSGGGHRIEQFTPSRRMVETLSLTAGTVTVTVGSIVRRPVLRAGEWREREHLCLTVSFNHDIVDGAPAARFTRRFVEILASGDELRDRVSAG